MISATQTVNAQNVRSHYDELDELYRALWGTHLHHGLWLRGNESLEEATSQLILSVAEKGEIRSGDRICDIGCGYGETAKFLAETYKASVTGATITPSQFEHAQKIRARRGRVSFVLEDWLENSLADSRYDCAIAIESSEHAVNKAQFFKQAARILKPGGRLVVCAWIADEKPSSWASDWLLVPICNEGRLPSLGTVSDYRKWLQSNQFQVASVEDLSFQVQKTWSRVVQNLMAYFISHPWKLISEIRKARQNRDFFWTPFRMWMAYQTGALHYIAFSAVKASP